MRLLACFQLVLLLALAACSGSHAPQPENLYREKARDFTADGMAAMQRERWQAAERAFSRSLRAAQLADDEALVRLSWYNIGIVREAMGRPEAEEAYRRAAELAARQRDEIMHLRATLALRLMHARKGEAAAAIALPKKSLPTDIYLQHARLSQLVGDTEAAERSYHLAIARARKTSAGMRMRANAHMGLALLHAKTGDRAQARRDADQALEICHQIGAPRVAAHALLLKAELEPAPLSRRDYLERALAIYTAVEDHQGQRQALERLIALAESQGDEQAARRSRMMLESLSAGLSLPPSPPSVE